MPSRLLSAFALVMALAAPPAAAGALDPGAPARVHMVVWRGCEDACQAFRRVFEERDLPVEVTVTDVDRDEARLPGVLAALRAERPDLVVTWGTNVSVGLIGTRAEHGTGSALGDIPALFMIVADPVRSDLVAGYDTSGRRHVTGVRNRVPEETQVQLIRAYAPVAHLGVLENPKELNSRINTAVVRDIAAREGLSLTVLDYPLGPDDMPDPASIPALMDDLKAAGVDAVYVGSSSFNLAQRDLFTAAAVDRGLPVFSAYAQMVEDSDALMAVANAYANVGRLAADQALKILDGGCAPIDLPIAGLDRYSVFINMDVARRLDLYPPIQLIGIAELAGGRGTQ